MIVLDASAVLAVMLGEPGGQTMAQRLSGSLIGVANLSEVLAKVAERGMDPRDYQAGLSALGVEFAPVTTAQAIDAAVLRPPDGAPGSLARRPVVPGAGPGAAAAGSDHRAPLAGV